MSTSRAASILFCAIGSCATQSAPGPDDRAGQGFPSTIGLDGSAALGDARTAAVPGQTRAITVAVGSSAFTATLADGDTTSAFRALLPLTLEMPDLNGNEKHVSLGVSLPTAASAPGAIRTGDLMLYGSNTLVLFYRSFSTPYAYTPIGRVDDASGLAAALGSGAAMVRFELR